MVRRHGENRASKQTAGMKPGECLMSNRATLVWSYKVCLGVASAQLRWLMAASREASRQQPCAPPKIGCQRTNSNDAPSPSTLILAILPKLRVYSRRRPRRQHPHHPDKMIRRSCWSRGWLARSSTGEAAHSAAPGVPQPVLVMMDSETFRPSSSRHGAPGTAPSHSRRMDEQSSAGLALANANPALAVKTMPRARSSMV
ncbi:hypothetical protein K402DRAFT_200520 [Aulographum hederae CBS 113979]|uniref:Uncharacterized protein n=1 Tax=Aulographum hederae CBS 113979 TaxID=1176131 RepID=A0A6G1HC59_9PEZI|nr:hypothetical protein K402DRAFT_200520 [Aulographum hederae CBS 113979]